MRLVRHCRILNLKACALKWHTLSHAMPHLALTVRKADGTREPFVQDKLRQSLRRAGARPLSIDRIVRIVEEEGKRRALTTYDIYRLAFKLLKEEKTAAAGRYNLKRAIFSLGPTGFPFEEFVAEIFRALGFHATVGVVLEGACATHELDVIAANERERIGVEVKFHNSPGVKTDLKVVLYVWARFVDLNKQLGDRSKEFSQHWVLTNTKFTAQARRYAACTGLHLVGWSYPRKGNLQDLIEETRLHPITTLTTLPKKYQSTLLEKGIVLCRTVRENREVLREIGMDEKKMGAVLEEIHGLCPG